jgi:hypothetical protein
MSAPAFQMMASTHASTACCTASYGPAVLLLCWLALAYMHIFFVKLLNLAGLLPEQHQQQQQHQQHQQCRRCGSQLHSQSLQRRLSGQQRRLLLQFHVQFLLSFLQ